MPAQPTNPEALAYVTGLLRPAVNELLRTYVMAKKAVQKWDALKMADKLPPGDATVVADDAGAQNPNKPIITCDQAYGGLLQLSAFVQNLEANNNTVLTSLYQIGDIS